MTQQNRSTGYDNPFYATLNGILDVIRKGERIGSLGALDRIDGKTCLITGANRGLGKAIAIELARAGGHVVMACRSGYPDAAEEVRRRSGSSAVENFISMDSTTFRVTLYVQYEGGAGSLTPVTSGNPVDIYWLAIG